MSGVEVSIMSVKQLTIYKKRFIYYNKWFILIESALDIISLYNFLVITYIRIFIINFCLKKIYNLYYTKKMEKEIYELFKNVLLIKKESLHILKKIKNKNSLISFICHSLEKYIKNVINHDDIEDYLDCHSEMFLKEMDEADKEFKEGNFWIWDLEKDKFIKNKTEPKNA